MASHIALQLCPHLILCPARFGAYQEASAQMRAVCESFGPCAMMSLDEAYIDLTDYLSSTPEQPLSEVVTDLRAKISRATSGLTVSCGAGSSALVAKIGADVNKPNGQHCVPDDLDSVRKFMDPLSIRKLPGYVPCTRISVTII
jgi:DNA polymerase kappa